MKITYWKNLLNGSIYKYYGDSKPLNYSTDWREVSGWDYENQFVK